MPPCTYTHASPRRDAAAYSDGTTGEIRVPLTLYCLDTPVGEVDLVLARAEGEQLLESLGMRLPETVETLRGRRPEAAR